jgi:hypothetical protein
LPYVPPIVDLIFARLPIGWDAWIDAWNREKQGQAPNLLPTGLALLPPATGAAPKDVSAERNGEEDMGHSAASMLRSEAGEVNA